MVFADDGHSVAELDSLTGQTKGDRSDLLERLGKRIHLRIVAHDSHRGPFGALGAGGYQPVEKGKGHIGASLGKQFRREQPGLGAYLGDGGRFPQNPF